MIDLAQYDTTQLRSMLRHQCIGGRGTTMGSCAQGCGGAARGCGVCRVCLAAELNQRLGNALADQYATHMFAANRAWWAMEDHDEA